MPSGHPTIISQETRDEILRLRGIGKTYVQISKRVGVNRPIIGRILRPNLYQARVDRKRNTRLHTTINGVSKRYPVRKRPYPSKCELCDRDTAGLGVGGKDLKLYWHHWDENDLDKGIWVCRRCHYIVGFIDYKGLESIEKYLKMKENHHEVEN